MTTFAEMFRDPADEIAELVQAERESGLDELELIARGMVLKAGEPTDTEGDTDG
jgi:hypothetical protein